MIAPCQAANAAESRNISIHNPKSIDGAAAAHPPEQPDALGVAVDEQVGNGEAVALENGGETIAPVADGLPALPFRIRPGRFVDRRVGVAAGVVEVQVPVQFVARAAVGFVAAQTAHGVGEEGVIAVIVRSPVAVQVQADGVQLLQVVDLNEIVGVAVVINSHVHRQQGAAGRLSAVDHGGHLVPVGLAVGHAGIGKGVSGVEGSSSVTSAPSR